jgi:class 3 adenylate cyclase/TolB-like protein/Tfp pilus assembly protein PilF
MPQATPESDIEVRRLAAILAADVVGYSRLMGVDEIGTLQVLKAHRRIAFDPAVASHRGRIVKTTGDGVLVEFVSAVDAVRCAVDIQREMAERNATIPPDRRIEFRIGINVGDIIGDGGDIFGDGVNVAARLEAMAEPGGICVSLAVRDPVRDKLAFSFDDLGEVTAKNIARPIRAFRVRHDAAGPTLAAPAHPESAALGRPPPRASRGWLAGGILLALLGLGTGAWLWTGRPLQPTLPLAIPSPASELASPASHAEKPALAVLPFANLSGDPAQAFFSSGISEEILTALARSPYLKVIGRISSFAVQDRAATTAEIGKLLGARYLLEGSVQRAGEQVRVTAKLIDTATGAQVWADRFDRPAADIFAVQDEITRIIAARLVSNIQKAELDAMRTSRIASPNAYDLFLRGRAMLESSVKQQIIDSRALLENAIAIDPDFALAYAELALTYYTSIALRWDQPPRPVALAKGLELAARAVALDPGSPLAKIAMGKLLGRQGDHDEAIRLTRQAIALNPNDPEAYAALANLLYFVNRNEEALPLLEEAFRLEPLHPPLYDQYYGRSLLTTGRPLEALAPLRDCIRRSPEYPPCHQFLAASLGQLGQREAAHAALADWQKYTQIPTIAALRALSFDILPGAQIEILYDGLEKAGLPRE